MKFNGEINPPKPTPKSLFAITYSYWLSQKYVTLTLEDERHSRIVLTSPLSYWLSDELTLEVHFKTQGEAINFEHRHTSSKAQTTFQEIRTVLAGGKGLEFIQKDNCVTIKTTVHPANKEQLKRVLREDDCLKLTEAEKKQLQHAIQEA